MSFLSLQFALFLAAAFTVFHLTPPRWRAHVLLGISYAFYLTWTPVHAVWLLGLTTAVYLAALAVARCSTDRGKFVLTVLAVTALIALLAAFKWSGWLSSSVSAVWSRGGVAAAALLVAPLGLSYFLFKMMGYLLDVYWEKIAAERSFVSLALYVSFFPQIVSGPIQRPGDFFGQLKRLQGPEPAEVTAGLRRILLGLVKKIVIADRFAVLVAKVHASPTEFSPAGLLLGAYCFALQLYLDFSGITDIAIGIGQLFGVKGPENFNLPFFAANVQEYWRRWHMSLTSWLSDYLFLPLRMSFRGLGKTGLSAAILINMLAIGIWHGAKWTYAAFGLLNGVFMIVSALTLKQRNVYFKSRPGLSRVRSFVGPLVNFHLIVFTMIFFRADTLRSAFSYVSHLIPGKGMTWTAISRLDFARLELSPGALSVLFLATLAMEGINWSIRQPRWCERFLSLPRFVRWGLYYAGVLIVAFSATRAQKFIYAQF